MVVIDPEATAVEGAVVGELRAATDGVLGVSGASLLVPRTETELCSRGTADVEGWGETKDAGIQLLVAAAGAVPSDGVGSQIPGESPAVKPVSPFGWRESGEPAGKVPT